MHTSLLVHRAARPALPTRACTRQHASTQCPCCAALRDVGQQLVDAAPRPQASRQDRERGGLGGGGDGAARDRRRGTGRSQRNCQVQCEHAVLPECCGYQYSVGAGGSRVTVVVEVRNVFAVSMRAVSLCVVAASFRTDCRSSQVLEIPPGKGRGAGVQKPCACVPWLATPVGIARAWAF